MASRALQHTFMAFANFYRRGYRVRTADFRAAAHYFRPPVLARAPALPKPRQHRQNRDDGGVFIV